MPENNLDYDVLAEDNIRTLHVPNVAFKKPICIILVGIPSSGKSFLTKRLAEKFPLTVFSEEDTTAFMSPRATIFKRNAVEVFQLAVKTIEHLIKKGRACIYDANIKTIEQRKLIKRIVEQLGGSYLIIFVDCPREVCYERLQKHNLGVNRGEEKGFILDKDFFEYEAASTHRPAVDEYHLTFDGQNPENAYEIESVVEKRLAGLN